MSEMSFEQMLEESLKTIHNGEVVEGTVIDVKEDEIILNIGYKADGIITKSEYTNDSSVNLQDVETGRSFRKSRSTESTGCTGTRWWSERCDRRSKSIYPGKPGI